MDNIISPFLSTDTFSFLCSEHVACFNECCRDLNQFLTPYDILRLKNRLGISSTLFLRQYTREHIGPETGLPVVSLKVDRASGLNCPFVTPKGCRVYPDRPSSCRMYPLARVASRSRQTGKVSEQYMLIKEPHCLGFEQNRPQTVADWLVSQELQIYNDMNDLLMEIISLKNRLQPDPLNIKQRQLFCLGLYDLDAFRKFLAKEENRETFEIESDQLDAFNDDTILLKFSYEWMKTVLFRET